MKSKIFVLLMALYAASSCLEAGYTLQSGKLLNTKYLPTLSAQEHYNLGLKEFEQKNWDEAARQFFIVTNSFPNSPYAGDSFFYLGLSEYYLREFDYANNALNNYLKTKNNPKFFQQAIRFKYEIAERLSRGWKRRFFGTKKMPKWASGKSLALQIYDEVIASLPCHDLAAKALYSKGSLLRDQKEYKRAVESHQMIIKRFPKHELAPESYVTISKIFLEQSGVEFQNPDVLEFAQINMRRFGHDFPREPRLNEVENDVLSIKEIYAKGLYDTGLFYERVGKPRASIIYFENAVKQFPDTQIAALSKKRLAKYQSKKGN